MTHLNRSATIMMAVLLSWLAIFSGSCGVAAAAATATPSSAPCPFNYPVSVNNTRSGNGLVFTIASNNTATNNRAVQLHANGTESSTSSFGAVDVSSASPVLLANLHGGGLYSQTRERLNQLRDLGPTARLDTHDQANGTTRYSFVFAEAGNVDKDWILTAGSSTGTYNLYHAEPHGVVNGFLLCEAGGESGEGSWYRLFYYTYTSTLTWFPGCEPVGLRTTVAPIISNGACDIGGYVAS